MRSETTEPVLVIGASGKVGSALLTLLQRRGISIRAATRTPRAHEPATAFLHWVHLDLDAPETYAPALDGVATVFLMARPGDERPETTAVPLISAMQTAGVRRVVNLTAMGCETRPEFGLRRVELALEASGLAFTHLRPNFFMQIFCVGPHFVQISRLRQIRLPAGDARISFVDARDIAAVAERCITEAGHEGRGYTLTGPEGYAHADIAAAISSVSNAPVEYVDLSDDEARQEFLRVGLPRENVERLLSFYRIVRTGAAGTVSSDVERVLGSPARSFATFASEYAPLWNVP